MRRITKLVALGIAVILILVLFFAPITLWFALGSPIAEQPMHVPVYRSLGCATVGIGDLYSPGWFGFSWGCTIPVPIPV